MKTLFMGRICSLSILMAAGAGFGGLRGAGGTLHPPHAIDIRAEPYAAAGDGKTDDTRAIQSALDAAGAAGGGVVFVPPGRYLIRGHLVVPAGTSLTGVARAPQTYSENSPGSTLLAVEGAGNPGGTPFLTLTGPNSTLDGIAVLYPNQVIADAPVPYPWTVRAGAHDNISLINVLLVNPYQGVDFGTEASQRHYIRGLYGQPLFKGLWVDQCYDIGRIHDVHFWPFWTQDKRIIDFTLAKATAFIFQRTDWEVVDGIFCWGYHVGIELSASKSGGINGQMTNVDLDAVDIGIDARYTTPPGVAFSNLAIANDNQGTHHIAIWGREGTQGAHLFIRGGSFWGDLNRIVKWEIPGTISLSQSQLVPRRLNGPMVEVLAGQAMIHDNSMALYPGKSTAPGAAILIGPGVRSVIVHGNQLNGNQIVNQAGERATVTDNRM